MRWFFVVLVLLPAAGCKTQRRVISTETHVTSGSSEGTGYRTSTGTFSRPPEIKTKPSIWE